MSIHKYSTNTLYPVFLKLDRLHVLIIGAGSAGTEKVSFMLKSSPDANITLVATSISDEIKKLAKTHPNLSIQKREVNPADFENKDLVIIATENKELNEQLRNEAKQRKILINVADTPELCDFYLGSIVTKGDLKIAISTNGKSPTFAKRFRMILEDILPEELPEVLNNLRTIRDRLKGDFSNKVKALNKLTSNLAVNNE